MPTPSYPSRPERTLAFLGDAQDPWCAPLFDELRPWAQTRGWTLITYDCAGSVKTQRGQLEDLLRTENVTAAVLYDLGDGDWRAEAVETLEEANVRTVTLSCQGPADVGLAQDQPWAAAMEYFGDGDVLLLTDLPDDPGLSAIREALGPRLAGHGACWSTPQYAADYLAQALPLYPRVSGVLSLSRPGAIGAKQELESRAPGVKVLCLDPSPEATFDLALGRFDATLEISRDPVPDALEQALAGQTPQPLAVTLKTA